MEPAEPLRAVPEGDKQGRQARRLALGFGLMLVAGALSDGGVLPLWVRRCCSRQDLPCCARLSGRRRRDAGNRKV